MAQDGTHLPELRQGQHPQEATAQFTHEMGLTMPKGAKKAAKAPSAPEGDEIDAAIAKALAEKRGAPQAAKRATPKRPAAPGSKDATARIDAAADAAMAELRLPLGFPPA